MTISRAGRNAKTVEAPFELSCDNNILINGRHRISQFNGNTSVTLTPTANYVTDGWQVQSAGIIVSAQRVSSPFSSRSDLQYGLKTTITTANTSLAVGQFIQYAQNIEGTRLSNTGSNNHASVVIGVMLKSNITLTGSLSLRNGVLVNSRSYVTDFTLVANTDTWVTTTIPADTSGLWSFDNTGCASLCICFGTGTTFQGVTNTWLSGNYIGDSNTTNLAATAGNWVVMSDAVMMPIIDTSIPASVYLPYERMPLFERWDDDELRTCQRYWQSDNIQLAGYAPTSVGCVYYQPYKVVMRTSPSVGYTTVSQANCIIFQPNGQTASGLQAYCATASTGGYYWYGTYTADARF
jgi:hypothetical protein